MPEELSLTDFERVKPHEYAECSQTIKTIGDLRKLIKDQPDDLPVYLFRVVGYDTVYPVEAGIFTQECIEHSGLRHEKTGLIIQSEG